MLVKNRSVHRKFTEFLRQLKGFFLSLPQSVRIYVWLLGQWNLSVTYDMCLISVWKLLTRLSFFYLFQCWEQIPAFVHAIQVLYNSVASSALSRACKAYSTRHMLLGKKAFASKTQFRTVSFRHQTSGDSFSIFPLLWSRQAPVTIALTHLYWWETEAQQHVCSVVYSRDSQDPSW